jgi:hypothetical protein
MTKKGQVIQEKLHSTKTQIKLSMEIKIKIDEEVSLQIQTKKRLLNHQTIWKYVIKPKI